MDRTKQLSFCKNCNFKQNTLEQGIICSITNSKANFIDKCENYSENTELKLKNDKIGNERKLNANAPSLGKKLIILLGHFFLGTLLLVCGYIFIDNSQKLSVTLNGVVKEIGIESRNSKTANGIISENKNLFLKLREKPTKLNYFHYRQNYQNIISSISNGDIITVKHINSTIREISNKNEVLIEEDKSTNIEYNIGVFTFVSGVLLYLLAFYSFIKPTRKGKI